MKKTVFFWSITMGAAALLFVLVVLYGWLTRPVPISLDDPQAQPIKDVLVKSHKLEAIVGCISESDVNMLDEVYKDTADYKQTADRNVMIAKYLGQEAVDGAGYLTFKKAYYLWRRSGDLFPRASPDPTLVYLATTLPTSKPSQYCPDPLPDPELSFQSIAIRENEAIAVYQYGPYLLEEILRRFDGRWFVVSSRALSINP